MSVSQTNRVNFFHLFAGNSMPLPCEQDICAPSVAAVARHGGRAAAPLAAGEARPRAARRAARRALRRAARHRRHVLHARLQRQPELASHTIAITPELFRRGTVQDSNIMFSE